MYVVLMSALACLHHNFKKTHTPDILSIVLVFDDTPLAGLTF